MDSLTVKTQMNLTGKNEAKKISKRSHLKKTETTQKVRIVAGYCLLISYYLIISR